MATRSKTLDSRVRALADGNQIPVLGLGIWQVPNGPIAVNAVRWALDFGYRHIDTAQVYGNEESVGRALRESGVPRNQVFITTKFNPSRKDPAAEAERSLQRLGTDYVDLYLVHWPPPSGRSQAHARAACLATPVSHHLVASGPGKDQHSLCQAAAGSAQLRLPDPCASD